MIRVGVLGAGFLAGAYVRSVREVRDAEVTAVYARRADRAAALAEEHGIAAWHDDMAALCGRADVDAVLVALPNDVHLPAVRVAAAAGKPVLCTKPLARDAREAAEMLRLVRTAGVIHGYGESEAYAPAVRRLVEVVGSGALGRIHTLRSRDAHAGPHADHFWDHAVAGGGALLDMGCHALETARLLVGKGNLPTAVAAWGAGLSGRPGATVEDNAVMMVRFAGGEVATIEASWTQAGGMVLHTEAHGSSGTASSDITAGPVRAFSAAGIASVGEKADQTAGWVTPMVDEDRSYGYVAMVDDFLHGVAGAVAPAETFVDGYVVNEVLDAAYRAMRTRVWEPVSYDRELLG